MKFHVMQHNDHDWRKPCEGRCGATRTVEADSAADAVRLAFITHPNVRNDNELVDVAIKAEIKRLGVALGKNTYMIDMGEADDDWFAFQVMKS